MAANISFTSVIVAFDNWSTQRAVNADYVGPKSYPANGDPIVGSDFKTIGTLSNVVGNAIDASGNLRLLVFDPVNNSIRWYVATTGVEVAAAVDLSAFSARIQGWGQ